MRALLMPSREVCTKVPIKERRCIEASCIRTSHSLTESAPSPVGDAAADFIGAAAVCAKLANGINASTHEAPIAIKR
jgi:hypothetical protein